MNKKICTHCGQSQSDRQYWKHIINNDEGLKNSSEKEKRGLLEYILLLTQKYHEPTKI